MKKRNIIIAIGVIICITLCVPGVLWYQDYKSQIDTLNETSIQSESGSTETEMETITDKDSDEEEMASDDKNDIDALYAHVLEEGSDISDLQKEFAEQTWAVGYDSEHWEEALDETYNTTSTLTELFLDDSTLYVPWYSYDITLLDPVWIFSAGLNYSDTEIPVSWRCLNDDGQILAAAVADYDVESDIFWNLRVYTTPFGTEYLTVDESDEYEEEEDISSQQFVSGVKSIAEALEEYTKPLVVDPGDIPYKYTDDDEDEEETRQ